MTARKYALVIKHASNSYVCLLTGLYGMSTVAAFLNETSKEAAELTTSSSQNYNSTTRKPKTSRKRGIAALLVDFKTRLYQQSMPASPGLERSHCKHHRRKLQGDFYVWYCMQTSPQSQRMSL